MLAAAVSSKEPEHARRASVLSRKDTHAHEHTHIHVYIYIHTPHARTHARTHTHAPRAHTHDCKRPVLCQRHATHMVQLQRPSSTNAPGPRHPFPPSTLGVPTWVFWWTYVLGWNCNPRNTSQVCSACVSVCLRAGTNQHKNTHTHTHTLTHNRQTDRQTHTHTHTTTHTHTHTHTSAFSVLAMSCDCSCHPPPPSPPAPPPLPEAGGTAGQRRIPCNK